MKKTRDGSGSIGGGFAISRQIGRRWLRLGTAASSAAALTPRAPRGAAGAGRARALGAFKHAPSHTLPRLPLGEPVRRTRTDRLGSPHARRRVSRSIQGRRPAQDKLGLSDESGLLPCCAARTCLVLAAFASSLYAPYENLMGLAGGLCAVPLAFIFPGWFHLRLCKPRYGEGRALDITLVAFGVVMAPVAVVSAILSWH